MGTFGGYVMIWIGFFIILLSVILGEWGGMEGVFKIMTKLAMKSAPVNDPHEIWMVYPMSVYLIANVHKILYKSEDGFLATGEVHFEVTMSTGMGFYESPKNAIPAVYIQEDAEFDEINRYVIKGGPLNYPSIFCWIMALSSLWALVVAIKYRVKTFKQRPKPNERKMSLLTPGSLNMKLRTLQAK